jgi:hypothetical protein
MRATSVPSGVRQRKTTDWLNPTDKRVTVILHDEGNRRFAFTVEPGETKSLDSVYDRAIQTIDCGRDECHSQARGGHFCNLGHEGTIQAGLAPMLKRVGKNDELIDELNVPLVEKKNLESRLLAASQSKEIQTTVAEGAVGRLRELNSEIAKQQSARK